MAGRPTVFNERKVARLLDAIAAGATLEAACQRFGFPVSTVAMWAARDTPPGFRRRYFAAFQAKSLVEVDKILAIVDGVEGSDSMAAVQAARTRADVRRWFASKLVGEFADRVQVEHDRAEINIYLPAKGSQAGADARVIDHAPERIEDRREECAVVTRW
jgi:hypothetical protein